MKIEKINKLMNTLLIISSLAILVGAFFKLQHYPHGDIIFWCGIWSEIILSGYEISRLKQIIAKLKPLVNVD